MSNPWLKKNPLMSVWLSSANSVANTARGKITAEAKRQSKAAISRTSSEIWGAWPGVTKASPSKRKKNRFPGV